MSSTAQETCRLLEWDTQFFGLRIARVATPLHSDDIAQAALEWCRKEKIACLYYLVPCEELQSIYLAQKLGFRLVDVRLTFERSSLEAQSQQSSPGIRPAQENDIPFLREIARLAYHDTRFFNDGKFPVQMCENLYMTWIEKSCRGYADLVWVASPGDEPAGFITCHLENAAGQIALLGIHPSYHHQGWGGKLVTMALGWFKAQHCSSVKVVTQGNNRAAQNLYEQRGFQLASVELWYHRWFEQLPEEG